MTTEERLTELLNAKDEEIEALKTKVYEAEELAEQRWEWTRHETCEVDPSPTLPIPRLELRWSDLPRAERHHGYTVLIRYDLVYKHLLDHIVRVPMGSTMTTRPRVKMGRIDLPFRDGAHIRTDARSLNLPAFAIDGERVERIEPAEAPNG